MSFKDELRKVEPKIHSDARIMLENIKKELKNRASHGNSAGAISVCGYNLDSLQRGIYPSLWPIIYKDDITVLPRKLFQKQTIEHIHLEFTIRHELLEIISVLKQLAAEEEIIVSDPYFMLDDIRRPDGKRNLIFKESHITYDYEEPRGLDGREQRVWVKACIDFSITL